MPQSDVHADTRSHTARKLGVNPECDYVPQSDSRSLFAEGRHAGYSYCVAAGVNVGQSQSSH